MEFNNILEDRVVAFIDILGFKEAMYNKKPESKKRDSVIELLTYWHKYNDFDIPGLDITRYNSFFR